MSRIIVSNHTNRQYVVEENSRTQVMKYYDVYLNKSAEETVLFCYNTLTDKIEYTDLELINNKWSEPTWVSTGVSEIKKISITD